MGDGIAMGNPSQEKKSFINPDDIELDVDFLGPRGIVSDEAIKKLEEILHASLVKKSVGATKNILLSSTGEIILLLNSRGGARENQFKSQIDFYNKFSHNPIFVSTVVPIEKVIKDIDGEVIGMTQKYIPQSIIEFKKKGNRLSENQINDFVINYRKIIELTGIVHGDFVSGSDRLSTINWDNIRVDFDGKLFFIDYNGQDGRIVFNGEHYYPDDPGYQEIKKGEPERVRAALSQYFGFNEKCVKIAT